MTDLAIKYLAPLGGSRVLDVGSLDVNGTYKPIFQRGPEWTYVGLDIEKGKNVDRVCPEIPWDLPDPPFDAIISGQCLEHVERPWLLVPEMARHLRRGGRMIVIAPFIIHEHRYPIDAWRFLPDGFRVLCKDAGLAVLETAIVADAEEGVSDTYFVAEKP
jgi:SAM-dependent methyltransferase